MTRVSLSELGKADEECTDVEAARAALMHRVPGAIIGAWSRPQRAEHFGRIVEWTRASWRRPDTAWDGYDGLIIRVTEISR